MRRHAPATERNRDPILSVLRRVLPERGTVLELGSGTGQHTVYFAKGLPALTFQPTDRDPSAVESIEAWRTGTGLSNILPARQLDVHERDWTPPGQADAIDAILCINVIHISPWSVTEALMAGADRHLSPGGVLYLYGPYRFDGAFTAPSNAAFDRSLRARDPSWGVRDLAEVGAAAEAVGFVRRELVTMPANNHSVVFERVAV